MRNFVQAGVVITHRLAAAVASGDLLLIGSLGAVATGAGAIGDQVACKVTGVFTLPKVEAQAWTVGAKIYWAAGSSQMTTASSGNTLVGVAAAAAANPSTTGQVRLDGVAR